jgi:hypothetical protein
MWVVVVVEEEEEEEEEEEDCQRLRSSARKAHR